MDSPVNYEFLSGFTPRIIDVVERDAVTWSDQNYELYRPKTLLHVLALVGGGRGVLALDDYAGDLQPGDLFHFAPGATMRITSSREKPLRYRSVHFDYGLLRWDGAVGVWQPHSQGPLPFPCAIRFGERPALHDHFQRLLEVWNTKDIGYEWRVRAGFIGLLDELAQMISASNGADEMPSHAIRATIGYIKRHLSEPLDRDLLAQHVALSPSYFSTLFKQHTGASPTQYIHKLRIDRAKQLLQTTQLPIQRVAEEVGFASAYYFTRVFTRETGLSPRSYRRS